MATLVANTVPLVQSIGIAAATLNNRTISAALAGVAQGVKRGEGIANPLRKAAVFPPLAGHLSAVGEETGRLAEVLGRHWGRVSGCDEPQAAPKPPLRVARR